MCVFRKSFKDNVKPAHWVGHSKLRSLDTDNIFKITPKFDENQDNVTENIEKEEYVAEDTNDDADENTKANEINDKNKGKLFTMEEEKKNLGYQEIFSLDIKNISSKYQHCLEINIRSY